MKKYYLFFSFILTILLISCEETFTSVKEIDIPEHDSKLAVFADISQNKGSFSVSYSKSITDSKDYVPVSAEITILEQGNPFFKMSFSGSSYNSFKQKTLRTNIVEGYEYTLIVDSEKFGTATSKQIVPAKPDFSNVKFKKDGFINNDGFKSDQLSFDLKDDKNTVNFYMVQAEGLSFVNNDTLTETLYLNSNDPSVKSFWFGEKNGLIISDKNFNGTVFKIITDLKIYNNNPKMRLRVTSITKDYYHFLLSYNQYSNSNDNPFSEPVNVHNNIVNGYGLFQVSSFLDYFVKIE
jgi:hypothetical protein